MLDNVIDINFYPTAEARNSNLRHRPVGLGSWASKMRSISKISAMPATKLSNLPTRAWRLISYYAILASSELAKERGAIIL